MGCYMGNPVFIARQCQIFWSRYKGKGDINRGESPLFYNFSLDYLHGEGGSRHGRAMSTEALSNTTPKGSKSSKRVAHYMLMTVLINCRCRIEPTHYSFLA